MSTLTSQSAHTGDLGEPRRAGVAVAAAVAIGILPLFAAELVVMANMSMYQFYPFVFAFIGWMGWKRWQEAAETVGPRRGRRFWAEIALLVAALACLVLHAGLFGPWLGGAAGTLGLAAAVLALRRLRNVRLWDLWALLLVTMRLPLNLNFRVASTLQRVSSILGDYLLDVIGVLHYRAGNVIQLSSRELFVDEACSGVISVMSVIAVAAILAIVRERRLLHTLALVASGVLWAMMMNVLRICAIAIALDWYGVDWTHGAVHEAISLVGFTITFLAVYSTDILLAGLLNPIDEAFGLRETLFGGQRLLTGYNWLAQLTIFPRDVATKTTATARRLPLAPLSFLALLFVLAGVFHSYALWINYRNATANQAGVVALVKAIPQEQVAAALVPWEIIEDRFEERDTILELAPYSRAFTVRHPQAGLTATVSLDFPFYRKWHDVCGCYLNTGWIQLDKSTEKTVVGSRGEPCYFVKATLLDEDQINGNLTFANLADDGRVIEPPVDVTNLGYFPSMLIRRIQHSRQMSLNPHRVFQVQVFSTTRQELSAAEAASLQSLFESIYVFTQQFLAQSGLGGERAP